MPFVSGSFLCASGSGLTWGCPLPCGAQTGGTAAVQPVIIIASALLVPISQRGIRAFWLGFWIGLDLEPAVGTGFFYVEGERTGVLDSPRGGGSVVMGGGWIYIQAALGVAVRSRWANASAISTEI
ncbi:MAG: hypothetical protein JO145_01890 [Acidobacteriaceae bacterium]|nr:hypothetical protein [Acidobacteriaceae bacterium]